MAEASPRASGQLRAAPRGVAGAAVCRGMPWRRLHVGRATRGGSSTRRSSILVLVGLALAMLLVVFQAVSALLQDEAFVGPAGARRCSPTVEASSVAEPWRLAAGRGWLPRPPSSGQPHRHRLTRAASGEVFRPPVLSLSDLRPGQELQGVVAKIVTVGVFVNVGAEQQGLIPRSKLTEGYCPSSQGIVKIGETVTVWVCEADSSARKFVLTLVKSKIPEGAREVGGDSGELQQWDGVDPTLWFPAKVNRMVSYGAFVTVTRELEDGKSVEATGLVHSSELRGSFVSNPNDVVRLGQDVKVRVLGVSNQRLSLSMRKPPAKFSSPQVAVEALKKVSSSVWFEGQVTRVFAFGAFVKFTPPAEIVGEEAAQEVQGLVPRTKVRRDVVIDVRKVWRPGRIVRVQVVEVGDDKIVLSTEGDLDTTPNSDEVLEAIGNLTFETWLTGKVVAIRNSGVVVNTKVPPGSWEATGFVLKQDMAPYYVIDPNRLVNVGDEVKIRRRAVNRGEAKDWQVLFAMIPYKKALPVGQLAPTAGQSVADAGQKKARKMSTRASPLAFDGVDDKLWLDGIVDNVVDFGAFIQVVPPNSSDGVAAVGLLHNTQATRETMKDLASGQKVQVRVVDVQQEPEPRLHLSMLTPRVRSKPSAEQLEPFVPLVGTDTWLDAMVSGMANFGLFVQVKPPSGEGASVEGLLHITELSEGYIDWPGKVAKVGEVLQVRVESVEDGRLGLSRRELPKSSLSTDTSPSAQPSASPEEGLENEPALLEAFVDVNDGEWIEGAVSRIASHGAFVTVSPPGKPDISVDGYVHVTLCSRHAIYSMNEELHTGQKVKVRVLGINRMKGRLILTMLKEGESRVDVQPFEQEDTQNRWISGRVVKLRDLGAYVAVRPPGADEAAPEVEGLLQPSEIPSGTDLASASEALNIGQVVRVRVIGVDKYMGRISLSMKELPE